MKHPYFNQSFDKKRLKALISWVFKKSGEAEALRVLDLLKETGFRNATKAGISIGLHDLTTPVTKSWLVSESQQSMNSTEIDFFGAKITATERSQRIIDTWHRASESLSKQVVDYFNIYDRFNPVYIMALSGARGNFSQVRQLIGMRGLMADQQGKIVNFPIRSNLREGLTITEYFISCSGARKGLVDTALRTADTGYLTRRLVDVSHHVVVKRIRCSTSRGILFKDLKSYNKILLSLKERLIGRVLAEDISITCQQQDTFSGNEKTQFEVKKDTEISPKLSVEITRHKDNVFIRSPLTCGFTHEVCQLCYGWSISQGSLVSLGDAVGVIAAQSIGEPGTQLTMRTFHTGGVFSGDLLQEIRAPHKGTVEFSKAFQGLLIRTGHGRIAFLSKTPGSLILKNNLNLTTIPIPAFTMLFVRQYEKVEINRLLAEFSIQSKEGNQPIKTQQTIFAELSGKVIEDCSGKTYLKYLKESSFLKESLECVGVAMPLPCVPEEQEREHKPGDQSPLAYKSSICKQSKADDHTNLSAYANRFISPTQEALDTGDDIKRSFAFAERKSPSSLAQDQAPLSLVDNNLQHRLTHLLRSPHTISTHTKSNDISQFLNSYKTKDLENDTFRYVEPVKSGRLGLLKILSTRIGATFNYKSPLTDSYFLKYLKNSDVAPLTISKSSYKRYQGFVCQNKLKYKEETNLRPYLHPKLVKQNRFFLQTIAEHGDIVEEEYKNRI